MKGPVLPPDWALLSPLLDAALDTPPEERAARLAELSGGDERRFGQLQQLLAECEQDSPFLERPAGERFASLFIDDAVPLPQILGGRYRIEREIGRGGMARVYLAHDEKHARSVAVKVIRPDLAASLGRERFLREIGIAARLRHPNIVPLYDSGDTDGVLHFVMPYEDGPSLRARLASGPALMVSERVSILRDVARAIAYAHEHGIVHRDVKPDNVLLSGGAAVVTDFGIAKAVSVAQGGTPASTLTQSGAGIGTPAYMAPEQAVGDPGTDHRADIYSFGCLAYELFAGHPPFHGMPIHQIIAAHVGTVPVPVDEVSRDVPVGVATLIGRCLEKSPAARPQSAQELLIGLDGNPTPAELPTRGATSLAQAGPVAADESSVSLHPASPRTGVRHWIPWIALPIAAGVGGVLLLGALQTNDALPKPIGARQLRILPMENETGDPGLDYLASGITEGIAGRLQRHGGFIVRSGARREWPVSAPLKHGGSSGAFGSTILLRSVLTRVGDSLELRASVLDAETKREKALAARRFATSQLQEVESRLAAAVSGAVFRVARPNEPRAPDPRIDSLSYRLTLEGWHQVNALRDADSAKKLFDRAVALDETNARAWSGLSSMWSRQTITNQVPFDVGYERTSTAAARALELDPLQSSALTSLAFVNAWKYRNLAVGEELLRRAKAAEPSNPQIYHIETALYRHAWQWEKASDASRIAQQLDPLRSAFVGHEADILACQGRLPEAERMLQREIVLNPTGIARTKLPPILARLHRYDDALAAMRGETVAAGAASDAGIPASAHGAEGYWSIVKGRGRKRVAKLEEQGRRRLWVSPFQLMLAHFQAGDTVNAYASLDKHEREGDLNLVKLVCANEIDAVRETPRMDSVLKRIPAFPLR